MKKWSGAFW